MMGKLLGAALVLAAALWFVLARLRARRRQTALLRPQIIICLGLLSHVHMGFDFFWPFHHQRLTCPATSCPYCIS